MKTLNCWLFRRGRRTLTSCSATPLPSFPSARSRVTKLMFIFISLIIITIIICCVSIQWFLLRFTSTSSNPPMEERDFNLFQNYFRRSNSTFFQSGILVNNSKCRIPEVNIWSAEARPFLKEDGRGRKPPSCQNEKREGTINGLTFAKKQDIVISERVLKTLGLDLEDIRCCYQKIIRVQQSYSNYNWDADRLFQFSTQCYPMTLPETTPISGFIKVICTKRFLWFWSKPIHTDFHLLATLEDPSRDIRKKLAFWKTSNRTRPPNVLLLGIDSTSRINFRRWMPTTRDVLEESLGAVEMKGYTKVGENTFPNLVPLLSSYSLEELRNICLQTNRKAQDFCPYIWKNFSAANYLTAHIEDAPRIGNLNFGKTGFVLPPVDFYPRVWMLAAYGTADDLIRCVDSRRPEEIILRYLVDLVELFESHGVPYFITSWMTALTHYHIEWLQFMDHIMRNALLELRERGHLQNTVLLVMSDHGYRFLEIRKTTIGWYEDKLPALWLALPESLRQLKPTWEEALRHNSKQLTTPFDIHEALKNVLLEGIPPNGTGSVRNKTSLRGLSLFEKLGERSCSEAGVPPQYCACGGLSEYSGNASFLRMAADAVLSNVNGLLSSATKLCSRLEFGALTAAGMSQDGAGQRLVIGIRTAPPEDIELEAVTVYNASGPRWEVVDLLRSNRIRSCKLVTQDFTGSNFCQCSGARMVRSSGWIWHLAVNLLPLILTLISSIVVNIDF